MSISQIKKQIEEFSAYLGRDIKGLEKLRKLKESFNELRTQLSSSEQKQTDANQRSESAFSEVSRMKVDADLSSQEIHRLRQVISNLQREIAETTKSRQSDEKAEFTEDDDSAEHSQYRSAMKKLRMHLRQCPKPTARNRRISMVTFNRTDFSKGWSHQALWILGASIAALSAFEGAVTIVSSEDIASLESYDENGPNKRHQFISWFRGNIDTHGPDRDAICDIPTHLPNGRLSAEIRR